MDEAIFAASIDPCIFTIDLHESGSVGAALEQLEKELFLCFKEERTYCKVVHGIGEGILAKEVHQSLTKNPLVTKWKCNGGSCIVVL